MYVTVTYDSWSTDFALYLCDRLFDGWMSYFQTMRQCDPNFDFKININIGQYDLHFMV